MKRLCDVPTCMCLPIWHPLGWLCATHHDAAEEALKDGTMFPPEAFAGSTDDSAARAECYAQWLGRMARLDAQQEVA